MGKEKWEDPMIVSENVLPAHSASHMEDMVSLNGEWKFKCSDSPESRPVKFFENEFDTSDWDEIPVPCCWETKGYGKPYYFGAGFPSAINKSKKKIPSINHSKNCVGSYRKSFELPKHWQDKKIILYFGSVKSAFYCWVNGQYVGLGKGSMLPTEFDITPFVKQGINTICTEVYQFSDVTYLEDQDMWFLSGMYRDVTVYAQPKHNIADVYAHADLDADYKNAELTVEVTTEQGQDTSIRAALLLEQNEIASKELETTGELTKFIFQCSDVKKWSAEIPNLYTIQITLFKDGQQIQQKNIEFGFRTIEIKDARLLINGMPLKLRGINYHAFTPDNGYYVPKEVYEKDLQTMKRFNINAIRTSHYPQDDYFYTLCNRYGIYVMDECNLETHGVRSKNVPGDNPLWTGHVVDRMRRMVLRDRNHPCVVIWSLANESDKGSNFYKMKEAALELDRTRKIHYEGGTDLSVSDFLCDGYSAPEREQQFADGKDVEKKGSLLQVLIPFMMSLESIKFEDYKNYPIVATEYGHCMGNTGTDVEKHMKIFEASDRWCGGFIWDYKDKSITKGYVNGKPFQAYGGDFGVRDQKGDFGSNGATNWDGEPHQIFYEIKKAFQTIMCERLGDGTVEIFNRNSFVDADSYACNWAITCDGKSIESGTLNIQVPPRGTAIVDVPYKKNFSTPGEYFLSLSFALPKDTPWGKEGYVIAYEQWQLDKISVPVAPINGTVTVNESTDGIMVITGDVKYSINRNTGNIQQITKNGSNMLKAPLRPSFFRALTDADVGFLGLAFGKERKLDYWGRLSVKGISKPSSIQISQTDRVTISVENILKGAVYKRVYTFIPDGKISIYCEFIGQRNVPARIGMQTELDHSYDTFTWYGKGPHDTYWGREFSGTVGVFSKNVLEQDEHVRPQEHGNKQDVHWLTLTDKSGKGVRIEKKEKTFAASAWPYTLEQLQNTTHIHELPDYETTTLNIDCIQNGLGDLFVTCPECYKIQKGQKYEYDLVLEVI